MEITVKRIAKKEKYTIGKLYINGVFYCNTLEDTDRGLTQNMSENEIKSKKIYGETAIPTGTYKVTLDVVSPKFSKKQFYKDACNGKLPRLLNVPGYDGILIHVGDGPKAQELTYGCILVGKNTIVGQLTDGKETFKKIYKVLLEDKNNIQITIE